MATSTGPLALPTVLACLSFVPSCAYGYYLWVREVPVGLTLPYLLLELQRGYS